jgi:hypothetical protein
MNLNVPPELDRNLDTLRTLLIRAMSDLDRLKTRHMLVRAATSHHKHDFTRDVTGQPTTYTPATHTHAALYSPLEHNHDGTYATPSHTHAYASDTHTHNYQDGRYTLKPEHRVDVSRTTGGPV